MLALWGTVFVASLMGSPHCAGMCGPFVLIANTTRVPGGRRSWTLLARYHVGRLLTYLTFGMVAGLLGMAIDLGGAWAGIQRAALVVAGVTMIGIGALSLMRTRGWALPNGRFTQSLHQILQPVFQRTMSLEPGRRAVVLGTVTTLLPCGWLYAFVVVAAATADPLAGAASMVVFWVGTLPILTAMGIGWGRLSQTWAAKLPVISALLLIVVGSYTAWMRSTVPVVSSQIEQGNIKQAAHQVQQLDAHQMPCCQSGQDHD